MPDSSGCSWSPRRGTGPAIRPAGCNRRSRDVQGPLRLVLGVRGNLHQAHVEGLGHLAVCLGGIGDQHGVGDDPAGQHRSDGRRRTGRNPGRERSLHFALPSHQNGNLVGAEAACPAGRPAFLRRAGQAATLALERFEDVGFVGLHEAGQGPGLLVQRGLEEAVPPLERGGDADAQPLGRHADA